MKREQGVKARRRKFPRRFIAAALVLAGIGALLFYGPFEGFRLLWINTAMYSSHYQFLATALYSRAYIVSVLERNKGGAVGQTGPEPLLSVGKPGGVCDLDKVSPVIVSLDLRKDDRAAPFSNG